MITSQAIKTRARELGFDLCGVARAESYPELSFLPDWLERGHAATMTWMHRSADKRADVVGGVPGLEGADDSEFVRVPCQMVHRVAKDYARDRGLDDPRS